LAVLYPLGFAIEPVRLSEGHRENQTTKPGSGRIKAGLVLLYLSGAALLVSLHYNPFFRLAYPLAAIALAIGGYHAGNLLRRKPVEKNAIRADRKRRPTPYSFHFKGEDQSGAGGRWVNIVNPFRGTLVVGIGQRRFLQRIPHRIIADHSIDRLPMVSSHCGSPVHSLASLTGSLSADQLVDQLVELLFDLERAFFKQLL
jgi:hypothetical protein